MRGGNSRLTMTRGLVLLCAVLAAAALSGAAAADVRFGVADDGGKYADDGGGNFFLYLNDLGMTENRITALWDPTDGTDGLTIRERGFLDRTLPVAKLRGVNVVLSVYPAKARAFTVDTQNRIVLFAEHLQLLARRYPQVRTFIVGNEPNQPRFSQPQFGGNGKGGFTPVAGALWARVLAASYDALKAVDPKIRVVGLGLSPRGNDSPKAPSNVSRSPVRFLADLGAAYRKSGRTRPLMDALAFHPYPNSNDDPTTRGYLWPNAGLPNLGRIKQAFWDGFHGTGQPVFAEGDAAGAPVQPGVDPPVTLVLDEYGRQAQVISSVRSLYSGRENVKAVSETRQAELYTGALRRVVCEPSVTDFFLFHLLDEADLDRFQSGLLRADWTKRPAYASVRSAIAATKGRCSGAMARWTHTERVQGVRVRFGPSVVQVHVGEEAQASVEVFPADVRRPAILAAMSRARGGERLRANRDVALGFGVKTLAPGRYVVAVRLRAAVNPARTTTLVGPPLTVA